MFRHVPELGFPQMQGQSSSTLVSIHSSLSADGDTASSSMPGIHSRAQVVNTGQRWYQAKRVPLYIMVAGGFAGAATYLLGNRMEHPGVEATQSQKSDSLAEEQPGAHQAGADHRESSGRKASRSAGFHEGQNTDGIFPNAAIAKKLGEVMGDSSKDISHKSDK